MNENKKYMISSYGADVAVGLLDSETAEEDINLSHNLFNTHVNYLYYNGVLNFNSLRKFYRYLINKNFLMLWAPNKTYRSILRQATNNARSVINNDVCFRNFMPEIYQREVATAHRYAVRLNNQ